MKKQDIIIKRLLELNWQEQPTATHSKYRIFTRPGNTRKHFIGRNGAVRVGLCITKSFSLTGHPSWDKYAR